MFNRDLKYFYFGNSINNRIKNNLLKYKNISYVFEWDNDKENLLKVKNYCKRINIRFYLSNNINLAKIIKVDGIHIKADNKKLVYINKNKFDIIGTAHNQLDFYFKKQQGCKSIFLSPLFNTKKYSNNKILGILRFNLLSNNWGAPVYALGGINNNNIKKLKNTKAIGIGGISYLIKDI